ncbi:winged helix-turn-helix transcriptional regulator (plasmid) [Halorarum salinum]|uniref:Winged helix-turn-helix transcriptional regulator n=1 Tax=Halorarum salinum TaxID=2743089 RepID=A0A7D5LE47_9EURY|nr:winged helix-turn-helix transcriptional regulator [Halobaculum salinum]
MEGVLWYLLASSRGGPTRVRLVRAIEARPRNANQLASALDLDYTTVRHHLDVLLENNVVRRAGGDYGAVYLFTEQAKSNWGTVEEIVETVDRDATGEPGDGPDGVGDGATGTGDEAGGTEDGTGGTGDEAGGAGDP